jgi:hypothetical protein
MQVSPFAVMLAASVSLVSISSPPRLVLGSPTEGHAQTTLRLASRALHTPRVEAQFKTKALFDDSKSRVISSSVLAPGVRFVRARGYGPPQRIGVIEVTRGAWIRAVHTRAGPERAPFATVSSAVRRTHALAGINGMPTALDGHPMLVRDGRVVVPPHGPLSLYRHPRTGVGLTRYGSALFVTVDGRRASAAGMTLREFAIFLRALGAIWAVNLDGGASTTMVVRGKVTNSPSDPFGERPVLYTVLLTVGRPRTFNLGAELHELDDRVVPSTPQVTRSPEDSHGFHRPL